MPQNRNIDYLNFFFGGKKLVMIKKNLNFVARKLVVQQSLRGKLWKCSFRVMQITGEFGRNCASEVFKPTTFWPLCVCGAPWEDLDVSQLAGSKKAQHDWSYCLTYFPTMEVFYVKASWRTQKCWWGAYLASTWLPTILECTAMLMKVCWAGCRGTFLHSGNSQVQTLIHNRSNSHSETATWAQLHTQQPLNPSAIIHCTNAHEILMLAFTLFPPYTWIYAWTLSRRFVAHTGIQALSGTRSTINGVHTHCTLTYILTKVLVWEIPFQETTTTTTKKVKRKNKIQSRTWGNCTNKRKHMPTYTHCGGCQSVRALLTTTAQCLLRFLPLNANIWWTSKISGLCVYGCRSNWSVLESPSSLIPDPPLQEQHLPRPYLKHPSASKELSRNILPALDQSKHLLLIEVAGILGFIVSVLFRPQVSGKKTRQCTETQGRACSNPQTARKQQAPEKRGEVCQKLPHTAGEDDNCPSKMGCYFQSPFSTDVTYQVLLAGRESDRTNQHTKHSLIQ